MTAPERDLARRAARANLECWRILARATGRELIERDGMLTYFSMARAGGFNPTIVAEPVRDPESALERTSREYRRRGIPFGIQIERGFDAATESAALARGMRLKEEEPVMALCALRRPSPEIEVRRVAPEDLDVFVATCAAGFGDDTEATRIFTPPEYLRAGASFLAYAGGVPGATATCVPAGAEAGIFAVATLPHLRRRGLARAATQAALAFGFDSGADLAFLHASEQGAHVYRGLGFATVSHVRIYVDDHLARED